jgi:hypothetical protein
MGRRNRSGISGLVALFLGAVLIFIISGCGSSGGGGAAPTPTPPTVITTLSGTAAAGAPIKGNIHLLDIEGSKLSQIIGDNGGFSFDTSELTAPYLLWAEGMANAKDALFYSAASEPGPVNVTPATHCIVAMALGKNPVTYYRDNPNAPPPSATDIAAAKEKLAALLSKLLESMGAPAGFDLMTGQFAADGSGFDGILDVVDMKVDDVFVTILDRGSSTVLLKYEFSTGLTLVEETPEKVNDLCLASMDVLDAVKGILTTVSEMFVNERPSLSELETQLLPLMSDNFLNRGIDRAQLLSVMASPGFQLGFKYENVALYRKMKEHTFGDVAPSTFDELPDGYADGLWCTHLVRTGNDVQHRITSFVQETAGGPWKWHGDQNPFSSEGVVRTESVLSRDENRARVYSGIRLRMFDNNNNALNRFGMRTVLVLNDALPVWTSGTSGNTYNGILLAKDADPSVRYQFVTLRPRWGERYFEVDGLEINDITDSEFVYVGVDDALNIVHVWIDLLEKKPLKEAVLWKDLLENDGDSSSYFGEFLSIWGQPSEPYLEANDDTQIPLTFSDIPVQCEYAGVVSVSWQNDINQWTPEQVLVNPALANPALDLASWSSATLDISGMDPSFWPPLTGFNYIRFVDQYERWYGTFTSFRNAPVPEPSIIIPSYYLQYRTYSDPSNNGFAGYAVFRDLGLPISETDISQIDLVNANTSDVTPLDNLIFGFLFTYLGSWDSVNNRLNISSEPYYESYYFCDIQSDVPADNYFYKATTAEGYEVTSSVFSYPGKVELPVIDATTMQSEWVNGDLKLSWTLPAGTFDQVRVHIYSDDPSGRDPLLLLGLPNTMNEVTIPKRAIDNIKILMNPGSFAWHMQLRNTSNYNYARSSSDWVPIND